MPLPLPAAPRRLIPVLALLLACGTDADGRLVDDVPASAPARAAALVTSDDPAVQRARAALLEGRPFLATQLLAPSLGDPARRTPEVVLLAATAAGEWGGWSTVESLLRGEPWLDARFDGAARDLLARAALARRADSLAAGHAARAVASARTDLDRGTRLVLLARALDRLEQRDSAAATYRRAAGLLPHAESWLLLRAAGVTDDPSARRALLARVTLPPARARVARTEAEARERAGDLLGAATTFDSLGNPASALRLRLRAASAATPANPATLDSIRVGLASVLTRSAGTGEARTAAHLLDSAFTPLRAAEQLAIARALAVSGPAARAGTAYQAAFRANLGTDTDRLRYARLLFRLDRYADAAAQFALVSTSHPQAGDAAYERARALLRGGDLTAARAELRQMPARFPRSDAAARALYLLADLATDEGRDDAARRTFRSLAADYPRSPLATRARFNAAIIAYAGGAHATAAQEFDTLRARDPEGVHAAGATYWSGRAWQRAGRPELARERWRALLRDARPSYYATLAAQRLDTAGWSPATAAAPPPRLADVDSAMRRAATLEATGMDLEARLEYDALARRAGDDPARLLATAAAMQRQGRSSRGITLATRALARGAPADAATYRLLYPVLHQDVLEAEARERRLDPALVAALVRQESNFEPSAHSPAGARGLMQLMPPVGRSLARSMSFPVWDTALLFEPDVSLRLGSAHLATLVRQYDDLAHVLAAYNAGGSRVTRWRAKGGVANDPELFTERIPYEETRDYVRIVLRNREIYGALYRWPSAGANGDQQPSGSPVR